jgi:hypothetical protein
MVVGDHELLEDREPLRRDRHARIATSTRELARPRCDICDRALHANNYQRRIILRQVDGADYREYARLARCSIDVDLAIAAAMVLFVAGTIGLVAALTVPREQRGRWLGITIAMVATGALGFFVALSLAFG